MDLDRYPGASAPRIKLEPDGKSVARDANGNALGGVRSVYVDVPTATITPTSLAPGGVLSNPCAYVGYQLDFGPDKLEQSYGSHNGYVQNVSKDVKRLVKEGLLLPEAGREQIATARASNILT